MVERLNVEQRTERFTQAAAGSPRLGTGIINKTKNWKYTTRDWIVLHYFET